MKLTPITTLSVLLAANLVVTSLLLVNQKNASPADTSKLHTPSNSAATRVAPSPAIEADLWNQLVGETNAPIAGSVSSAAKTASAKVDYSALRDRLRAVGFPDRFINDIIRRQIRERFAALRAPLEREPQFWSRSFEFWGTANGKNNNALSDLRKQETEEIVAAAAESALDDPGFVTAMRREFGNISTEKAVALRRIDSDYQDLIMEAYVQGNGFMLPEDHEKLALLEKEKRADLVKVLTPAELFEHDLRSSETASSLRYELTGFGANEQEFRAIFARQQEFDLKYPEDTEARDNTNKEAREAAELVLKQQLKVDLGDARYADYERAQNHDFKAIANIVTRLDLPNETAVEVYEITQDIERRVKNAMQSPDPSDEAIDEAAQSLQKIVAEGKAKLTKSLGPRGLEAYTKNGGWWLKAADPSNESSDKK